MSYNDYSFRFYAVNAYGNSEYSQIYSAVIAPLPSQPLAPTKDQAYSTKSSIKVNWVQSTEQEPAIGYKVYMKGQFDLVESLIYDGSSMPSIFTFTKTGLTTGVAYSFYLSVVNFNGEGAYSLPGVYTACTKPSGLKPPTVTATTATTVNLVWQEPEDDGGCPLTGYVLYLDDGLGGSFTSFDSANVMN